MSEISKKYLATHCIGDQQVQKFRLKVYPGRVTIPVCDENGQQLFCKHRHFSGTVKYTYDTGAKVSLFNIEALAGGTNIYLVEGEADAMACDSYGVAALSSTGGCLSWQHRWSQLFIGKSVTIVYDRDAAGAQGAYRVWSSLNDVGVNARIGVIPDGYGKDVSDFLYKIKSEGLTTKLIYLNIPDKKPQNTGISKRDVKMALKDCLEYVKLNENIHTRYLTDIFKKNLIEEIRHLDVSSRKKPVVDLAGGADVKMIPITNFIDFSHSVTRCIFHDDHKPSMIYNDFKSNYPNTVKCFACGKFGSVIDVVMALNNLSFKEAVDFLKNSNQGRI